MPDPTDRARHLIELDRPAEALDVLHRVLAQTPEDALAHGLGAVAHLALEQNAEALASADAMLAAEPDSEWGHRLRSQALGGLRHRYEAMTAAAEAVRLDPQGWATHAQYALSAVHLPEHSREALAAAHHATALAPTQPDAHFAVGYVAARLAMHEESDAAYRQVLALDPTHTAARNNLTVSGGRSYGLGLRRAAEGFSQVLRQDPREQTARRNLENVASAVLVRIHVGVLLAMSVTAAFAASGVGPSVRALVAVLALAGAALAAVLLLRRLPPGVVLLLRGRLWRQPFHLLLLAVSLAMVAATVCLAVVPFRPWFADGVLRPLGLLNVLLLVYGVMRRRADG